MYKHASLVILEGGCGVAHASLSGGQILPATRVVPGQGFVYNGKHMRVCLGILAVAVAGCGGGQKNSKSSGNVEDSPGIRCIEEAKVVRNPPTTAPERVDLAHILVKHAGVRDSKGATRTREEACLRAMDARKKLLSGSEWDDVFKEYSDSQGATQGVLYDVTQGSLEPAFAGAAFSLTVDELSYVVETPRGYHIIWRKK